MFKRWLSGMLVAMMVVQPLSVVADEISVSEDAVIEDIIIEENVGSNIANPRIVPDSSMEAGQKVTYDCIWFGSYPQAEIIPDKSKYDAIDAEFLEEGDLIEDANLYSQLQSASYNSKNETTINGTRYRRMLKSDATYGISGSSDYYDWLESTTYHYFKYEPIKWRVIEKDSNSAFLLADKVIDDQKYNETFTDVTWETCILRNYLNSTFYDNAFNTTEKGMIIKSTVENADNLNYGTSGGNNTSDNVFLLAEKEVYKTCGDKSFADSSAAVHGFVDAYDKYDEARRTWSTTYAKAMGTRWSSSFKGICRWWMRSSGDSSSYASYVSNFGNVDYRGDNVDCYYNAVRPALKIHLSSLTDSMYAGTVCSDGTVNETAKPGEGETPTPTPIPTPTPTPVPTIVPEPAPTVTATPTVEATATPISEAAPIVITGNESNNLIVDDCAKIDISSVDKSKLLVKGKSGTYDASTGTFKAIKKGIAKLYYLDGKKKVVVCTIKVEQPKLKASLKMKAGKTKKLKLTGTKRTDAIWTSSDESVASMSGGIVTAKKAGECDIIAKIGNHEWKCHVVVK